MQFIYLHASNARLANEQNTISSLLPCKIAAQSSVQDSIVTITSFHHTHRASYLFEALGLLPNSTELRMNSPLGLTLSMLGRRELELDLRRL